MMALLTILNPDGSPAFRYDISEAEEITLGRAPDNQVVLADPAVSRHHAKLVLTAKGYLLMDEESENGIIMDQRRIAHQLLRHGDVFQMGDSLLQFTEGPAPVAVPQQPAADAGAAISAEQELLPICDTCGAVLNREYNICPRCGSPVAPLISSSPAAAGQPQEVGGGGHTLFWLLPTLIALMAAFAGGAYLLVARLGLLDHSLHTPSGPKPTPGQQEPLTTKAVPADNAFHLERASPVSGGNERCSLTETEAGCSFPGTDGTLISYRFKITRRPPERIQPGEMVSLAAEGQAENTGLDYHLYAEWDPGGAVQGGQQLNIGWDANSRRVIPSSSAEIRLMVPEKPQQGDRLVLRLRIGSAWMVKPGKGYPWIEYVYTFYR